ncbi:MAG: lipid-A-disaccharide synthase [Flavobacteriales bacterium]
MKIYMIAGEASGDLHGSNLIRAIRRQSTETDIRCWGGELMQLEGANLIKHYRDLAFMGFIEVLFNIRTILRNIDFCKKDILEYKPDVLVLIDYPGFNLRIAEWAKQQGIRVVYYISPQIWAWKENRIHKIKRSIDDMCVVLPFEVEFYKKHNYPVHFVGHPLLDEIAKDSSVNDKEEMIVLLPGSRKQEITRMLPVMLEAADQFPQYKIMIAGAPGQDRSFYEPIIGDHRAELVFGKTYDLLKKARAGMITSGTATLEAGLLKLPQVVCYRANKVSYVIAKRLVKIKYISLVNLILDRPAVLELIQDDLTSNNITKELKNLLAETDRSHVLQQDYADLYRALGGEGASERTAKVVLKT